ncbi:hypothetical protein [Mycobacterium montefiorense]|uniref:hypothetical protein n=1 Tax=Mycobacterium montefiorense TaxID=154654 RepID=UPI0021DD6184|nr:hypothetical protein [Mycobacterium montefiorense]MCV7428149.1 hypothetical protein [Mycobacterium montefiorense]GLE53733.1 hypothetical protein ATCCBAA256_32960 [Mycobacterium montefiorense]
MTDRPQVTDDELNDRITRIITDAIDALDAEDIQARVAWCQQHDAHGVRVFFDEADDIIEIRWGNKPLIMASRSTLLDSAPLQPPVFVVEPPDCVPPDWTDQ